MADCADSNGQNPSAANPQDQQLNSGVFQTVTGYNPNMFDPNKILAAVNTYNSLNYTVNNTLGMDTRWFRAVPQQRSKDVILQEYTLYCVEELGKCVKVMLNSGNFASDDYNYDLMGLEYEVPQEIQIDKKYWEANMGFGTAPQKKDIVYMIMPNKLYQVESSFLKRGFMQQETTWIINLRKYQPEASRREGDLLKQTIDQYTVSEEELFGPDISANVTKLVDDKQFSPLNSTEKDKYKEMNTSLKVVSANLEVYGIIVAQSYYDMTTSDTSIAITYKNSNDIISSTTDRSLTTWFKPKTITVTYDVLSITEDITSFVPANYKIVLKGTTTKFNVGDIFVISRPGALNFYAEVLDNTEYYNATYYCKIDDHVVTHLNSLSTIWKTARNYKMFIMQPINLIDGMKDSSTHKFKVDIYANQYIKVLYGDQIYVAVMNERLYTTDWYGIVVNIGNTWNQYNVYVWEVGADSTTKLRTRFYETINFTPQSIEIDEYVVNKSDSYLTNVRLFDCTIEEEHQSNELLSYFSNNADHGIILDGADLRFRAPYINQPR
jgi:hypothetical protein